MCNEGAALRLFAIPGEFGVESRGRLMSDTGVVQRRLVSTDSLPTARILTGIVFCDRFVFRFAMRILLLESEHTMGIGVAAASVMPRLPSIP